MASFLDDDASVDNSSADPPHILSINPSFAARLDRSGARAAEQRRRERVRGVVLPTSRVRALMEGLAAAAALAPGAGSAALPSAAALASAAIEAHRLALSPAAAALLARGKARPNDGPAAAAIAAFLGEEGRTPVARLLRWARGAALQRRAEVRGERGAAPVPVIQQRPERRTVREAARSDASVGTTGTARLCDAAAEGLHRPLLLQPVRPACGDAPAAFGGVAATCPPLLHLRQPVSHHPHGRGAGAGRGLTHLGEPAFADLHPSWAAKRKRSRHESKAVSKALRKIAVGGRVGGTS